MWKYLKGNIILKTVDITVMPDVAFDKFEVWFE